MYNASTLKNKEIFKNVAGKPTSHTIAAKRIIL